MSHKTKFKTRIRWRKTEDSKPSDGQSCLFKFKHGIIAGHWDEEEQTGYSYVWRDIEYYPTEWVPLEEIE